MKNLLLFPFRLVRELAGYNACFFRLHHWEWVQRRQYDRYDLYTGTRSYQRCTRCRVINLKTERVDY